MSKGEKDNKQPLNYQEAENHLTGLKEVDENNNLYKMVNASRASRNLPLEFIMNDRQNEKD